MCCFFTSLLLFGPRLAFLIYWLIPIGRVRIFLAFDTWIWPLLGLIFLPWTILTYVLVFPVFGFDWLFLGLAFAADMAGYFGGFSSRRQVPGYRGP
jgi:hypothetical protein